MAGIENGSTETSVLDPRLPVATVSYSAVQSNYLIAA
jgi:hypothetical protein